VPRRHGALLSIPTVCQFEISVIFLVPIWCQVARPNSSWWQIFCGWRTVVVFCPPRARVGTTVGTFGVVVPNRPKVFFVQRRSSPNRAMNNQSLPSPVCW
jgi:hypothetical protein